MVRRWKKRGMIVGAGGAQAQNWMLLLGIVRMTFNKFPCNWPVDCLRR